MSHWLIPANTKFYDVFSAFKQDEVYWPVNARISSGDIVYIYLSAPYKQVGFICNVLTTDHNMDEIIDSVHPFIKGDAHKDGPSKPFMKLKTLQSIPIDENSVLSLKNLKQNGLNGMLMGTRKLENNPELLTYIEKNLS